MKDGLLSRLGVAKVVHEVEDEYDVETYAGIDQTQFDLFRADEKAGKLTVLEPVEQSIGADGQPLFDIRVQTTKPCNYYRCYVVAPDEFRHEERLASLDDATLLGHETKKPVGDLIAMGLPKDKCNQLHQANTDLEYDDRFRG